MLPYMQLKSICHNPSPPARPAPAPALACRESCSLDMLPYMQLIQSKLQVSQSILRDVLPDHVVNLLVNAEDEFEPERNSLASPMTPLLGDDGEGGTVAEDDAFDDVNSMGVNVGGEREQDRESGGGAWPGTGGGLGHRSSMDRLSWGSSGRSAPSMRSSVAFAGSASSAGQSPLPMRTASPLGVPAAQGQHSMLRTLKLAENHDCVTVFLSDICGFSSWAHELPPEQVRQCGPGAEVQQVTRSMRSQAQADKGRAEVLGDVVKQRKEGM